MSSYLLNHCSRLAALPLLLAVGGCANRGNPRPPSLHLPALATNLKAERVAERVLLTWTTSDKTSDGLILHAPVTAIICRDNAAHPTASCTPISRLTVTPGQTHASDTLPPALLADPPRLLTYRIELVNAKNRSAGVSSPAFVPSGSAPPSPGGIHISATPRGAIIEWAAVSSAATMELTRTLVANAQGPISAPEPDRKKPSGTPPASKPKDPSAPVLLRDTHPSAADPGGLIDPAVIPHNTYTYTAQRVRTLQLDGHTYELRSAPSSLATFSYRDVFPPQPPAGLESIASAPITGQASIDLSWDASPETDILGYNVYRATSSSESFVRINTTPISSPSFRDRNATPGQRYRYRITALDRSNNESKPSPEIQDSLATQP